MEEFKLALRRLRVHGRVCWQRPRNDRTVIFEHAEEVVRALGRLESDAREVEVYRAGETRYVVYVRD